MDVHFSITSMCPALFPETSVSSKLPAGQTEEHHHRHENMRRMKTPEPEPATHRSIRVLLNDQKHKSGLKLSLTGDLLVQGQGQQRDSGLPHANVQLLLIEVKDGELEELPPQVLVQLCIHADPEGLGVPEAWVAAAVDGGSGGVWELKELEDHVGAGLLGTPGLKISAALHSDEQLVPPAAGHLQTKG